VTGYRDELDAIRGRNELLEEENEVLQAQLAEQRERADGSEQALAERDAEIASLRRQLGKRKAKHHEKKRRGDGVERVHESQPSQRSRARARLLRVGLLVVLALFTSVYVGLHGLALPPSFAFNRLFLPNGSYTLEGLLRWLRRAHAMQFCSVLAALLATAAVWLPRGPTGRMTAVARLLLLVALPVALPLGMVAVILGGLAIGFIAVAGAVLAAVFLAINFIRRGWQT